MAVKGTNQKRKIIDTMLKVFPDAFVEDAGKSLRIPVMDSDNYIEIKVALTCAKTPLRENAVTGGGSFGGVDINVLMPTEEELATLAEFLKGMEA